MTINDFFKSINISPKNKELYYEALTHKSFSNERRESSNYQRLEFLGDTILDFLVAEYIFIKYPKLSEGQMTIIKINTVKTEMLIKFSKELQLNELIRFGNSKVDFDGDSKFLADVFESLVGAIYLDQGIEATKAFLSLNAFKFIDSTNGKEKKNPKTILQELMQLESRGNVNYETIEKKGMFISTVSHDGAKFASGTGRTKKEAQVEAARKTLEMVKGVKDEIN